MRAVFVHAAATYLVDMHGSSPLLPAWKQRHVLDMRATIHSRQLAHRRLQQGRALAELGGHSHWVWAARFNPAHDCLLLSASSDSLVNLWYLPALSAPAALPPSAGEGLYPLRRSACSRGTLMSCLSAAQRQGWIRSQHSAPLSCSEHACGC
jgi:hypothetical protein